MTEELEIVPITTENANWLYKETFGLFDKNGDGTISTEELAEVMRRLGKEVSDDEIAQMVNTLDLNADGTIDYDEFLLLMEMPLSEEDSDKELEAAFSVFDKDGSGMISPVELKETMYQLGFPLEDDTIQEMMLHADENHDGQISFSEFKAMMLST